MPTTDWNMVLMPLKGGGHRAVRVDRADIIASGTWCMERFTVCKRCDRYTHTDLYRVCRPCFEDDDAEDLS